MVPIIGIIFHNGTNESKSIHSHGYACTLTKITLAGKYAGAVLVLPALVSH